MIRKNCTSSIKWAFLQAMGLKHIKNIHMNPHLIYKGIRQLNGEKVAAIIRNPLERALSNWQNKLWAQADNGRQRKTWERLGFKVRCSFDEYVERLQFVFMQDGHIKPQVHHLPLGVDYMLCMDDMPAQWEQLQESHPWLPKLPVRNCTKYTAQPEEDLTPRTKELLDRIYAKDLTLYDALLRRGKGLQDVRILQETLSGQRAGQQKYEIDGLGELCVKQGVESYLEVGARFGDTFFDIMSRLPKGSKGVCVDLPGEVWGTEGSLTDLENACEKLSEMGQDITLIIGDSTDPRIVEQVKRHGPYDAALLDGDHRYAGIKTDFDNYAPFCEMVALHDIVGHGQRHGPGIDVQVPTLWKEIKNARSVEFVAPGSCMGIGVRWNT